ncbi:Peroxisomal multifunctional enzyme type 2, partial [Pseudolycoriella hygida]
SDAVFARVKDRLSADQAAAKAINAVFCYQITSDGKVIKEWTLDLKTGEVYEGAPKTEVDAVVTISDRDMLDITLGKLNPQIAFMKGKLKIIGNVFLSRKLQPFFEMEAK